MDIVVLVNLFFGGLLAGVEVVVRFGVRGPLAALPEVAHLRMRQGLIRTLRVLVPSIYVPAFLSGIAVAVAAVGGLGVARWGGVVAMVVWTVTTFVGTAPLNQALAEWDPEVPPVGWRAVIGRWERMDTVRTVAAVVAFGLFLVALA
ncbi:anthrone oxygenase family protein [Umezawaea endophytica]|uniref:DUF1772 domain-containing protein n=1 Tax=Umezawaea endophytica TaxID=1654476 RepID=A0A9X2VVV4_9PSEU|nr:DUF1772 domain-containing protein [Umezawaea endophytica]MCS7483910.1 DUF1772 domain-containing protein [Umezawaea endophytica]